MKFLIILILVPSAFANQLFLQDFYNNPEEAYFQPVLKKNPSFRQVDIHAHFETREQIMGKTQKSEPSRRDRVQSLFPYDKIEKNIKALDSRDLFRGSVKQLPWSDDYWAIFKGILGNRYADPEFANLYTWKEAYDYYQERPYSPDFSPAEIDQLSPAEKFDLLLGSDFRLTKNMWAQGQSYYRRNGSVEKWMGICHGWAPASYKLKRPTQKISVMSSQGFSLNFYPSDIKALASLLWASTDYNTFFIGGRCNQESPRRDENGRVIRDECRDNNSSTFHLAVLHGVGIKKESFIIDATYDYEVWNQPLVGYEFEYFNPNTELGSNDLESAIIPIEEFEKDPFKKHRSKRAKYIVGVHMELAYGVETRPTHRETDSEQYDSHNSAYYSYDLELDEDFNIVGGEWYHDQHPDFMWRPATDTEALTSFDYYLLSEPLWDGKSQLNSNVSNLGSKAASRGEPLAYLVKSLINIARQLGEEYVD